jgi:hypothetical protein
MASVARGHSRGASALPASTVRSLVTLLGAGFSVNLLSYYVLPSTAWARYSIVSLLLRNVAAYNISGSLATVCLLLLVSAGLLCLCSRGLPPRAVPVALPSVLYFSVCGYALIHSTANWISFRNLCELLAAMGIGVIAGWVCVEAYFVTLAISLVGAIQAVYTLYYHHYGINDLLSGTVHRAGGSFNQPNGVSTVMLIALPIALAQALNPERPRLKQIFVFCAPVMLAALILTWERGGVLGAVCGMWWVLARRLTDRRSVMAACAVLACIVIVVIQYRAAGSQTSLSSGRSVQGRFVIWRLSEQVFLKNWLSGVGVGNVAITLPRAISSPDSPADIISQPKSVFMLWLDELGISGGLLFLLFAAAVLTTLSARRSDASALAYEAAWLSLFVGCLFDTAFATYLRPYGNVLWGCLLVGTALLKSAAPEPVSTSLSLAGESMEAGA